MSKTESFAEISQAIEHLAAIPTTAKTLADANAIRDIAESVGKRLRHLSAAIEPYRAALNETRQPGTVVKIDEQEFSNAHDAAIAYVQSWYFGLWRAVDFMSWMKAQTDPSIRFDPAAIEDQAERAIEHCQSWPDDGWQGVVAQIEQERTAVMEKEKRQWSKPDSPTRWAKVFGMSAKTLKRMTAGDPPKIRVDKLTTKTWRIHVDDLPP